MNFQKMTKAQLEEHGRTIGIELDRRKTKKALIAELKKASASAKKPATKKATAKKKATKKATAKKKATKKATAKAKKTNKGLVLGTQEEANKINKGGVQVIPVKKEPKLSFWARLKKFFNL